MKGKMNIYQKLNKARIELQDMKLKKSGRVSFTLKSGKKTEYDYYELADFLPAINLLCDKHGLMTVFNIHAGGEKKEFAQIAIFDIDSEEKKYITFESPTAESKNLGDALKDLGSKTTYLRRYLLMTAFEMVESDTVEIIKKEITDELSEKDEKDIRDSKTTAELLKVCGKLKETYKVSVISPIFEEMKTKLEQKESKA